MSGQYGIEKVVILEYVNLPKIIQEYIKRYFAGRFFNDIMLNYIPNMYEFPDTDWLNPLDQWLVDNVSVGYDLKKEPRIIINICW